MPSHFYLSTPRVRRVLSRSVRAAAVAAVACASLLPTHDARAAVPTGFSDALVAAGLDAPAGLAFLPDGRLLVTEQFTASIKVIPPGEGATTIFTIPDVLSGAERGLLGVAVDPDWPIRPYLYFDFSRAGSVIHVRMYTVTGDLSDPTSTNLTLGDPYEIITDIPDNAFNHNGGTLRFGIDDMLYVSTGDDASFCTAQDLTSLSGKILRLDVSSLPGAGSGPPAKATITPADNPFLPTGNENTALLYAYGLRNPFRFTIDPVTGNLYVGDVGAGSWEEFDECQGGENFGWPHREGAHTGPGTGCQGGPGTDDPIWEYPNSNGAAVVGGPRYRVSGFRSFPVEYEGNLFVHDYYDGNLKRLVFDGGSWVIAPAVPGQPSATTWATGLSGAADLIEGPDGALYYANQFIDAVRRISPDDVVTVGDAAVAADVRVGVSANPARSGAALRFTIAGSLPTDARIAIYDVTGGRVAVVPAEGRETLSWNGRTGTGDPAAPGVYLARVESGARTLAHVKVTLID